MVNYNALTSLLTKDNKHVEQMDKLWSSALGLKEVKKGLINIQQSMHKHGDYPDICDKFHWFCYLAKVDLQNINHPVLNENRSFSPSNMPKDKKYIEFTQALLHSQ